MLCSGISEIRQRPNHADVDARSLSVLLKYTVSQNNFNIFTLLWLFFSWIFCSVGILANFFEKGKKFGKI